MKQGRFLLLIVAIFFSVTAGIFLFSWKPTYHQDYVEIPIKLLPFTNQPAIKIEIEGHQYCVTLDLGSSHPIDLRKDILEKIKNKSMSESSTYNGISGNSYIMQGYKLPTVSLFNLKVDGLIGFEESIEFLRDAKFGPFGGLLRELSSLFEFYSRDGRLGWPFLKEGVAFFDFPKSKLFLAKNIDSISLPLGFFLSDWVCIPFEIEKSGLIIQLDTEFGVKKFLLDTGSTCSVLKIPQAPNSHREACEMQELRVGEQNLGPWKFRFLKIDPVDCDGILGFDFFKSYPFCLDFLNKKVYFKKL